MSKEVREKKKLPWLLLLLLLVIFHLFSFGPLVAISELAMKKGITTPDWVISLLSVIYHPHFYIMYFSEQYFNYIGWWSEMGGFNNTENAYEGFRQMFEEGY